MSRKPQLTDIPKTLAAPTIKELRQLMLAENTSHDQWHYFRDFQFVNNEWITWFYQDVETPELSVRKDRRTED